MPGAFADFLVLPAFHAVPLPDGIDDEMGAILDVSHVITHRLPAARFAGAFALMSDGSGKVVLDWSALPATQ